MAKYIPVTFWNGAGLAMMKATTATPVDGDWDAQDVIIRPWTGRGLMGESDRILSMWSDFGTVGSDANSIAVAYQQERLQSSQCAIGPPTLGEFNGRAPNVPRVFLESRLQSFGERKRVGRAARKPDQDIVFRRLPGLLRGLFHHGVADRDLPVRSHRDHSISHDRQHRRRADRLSEIHRLPLFSPNPADFDSALGWALS